MALLGIAAGILPRAARAQEDRTITPPPGDYRVVTLVLEGGGPMFQPMWGNSLARREGDLVIRSAFRDGKIRIPGRLSVRQIVSELAADAKSIRGEIWYQAQRDPYEVRFMVDAAINGADITGTYQTVDKARSGKVRGTVRTEADLRKENAFTGKADWPCWSGPFTGMAAAPCGLALVEDLNRDARLVWRSEEIMPGGNGNASNYNRFLLQDRSMGGGASAIVAAGKVFVQYMQPCGTEYYPMEALEAEARKAGVTELSPWVKEKYLKQADDIIVAMDASTGKTLWKTVFAAKGAYQWGHKGGPVNNTPCAGDGRVFFMGSAGRVYGLDAAAGKPLWEVAGIGPPTPPGRGNPNAPIYADGVAVFGDHGHTLYGFEAASGKELWKLPGKNHPMQVPCLWVHNGRSYVISLTQPDAQGASSVACIEPPTGRILWEFSLGAACGKNLSVHRDTLLGFAGLGTPGAQCLAFRMAPEKPQKIWSAPCPYAAADVGPAVNDKYVVVGGREESHMLDLATGTELAAHKGAGLINEGFALVAEDRVFLSHDGSHGHCEMTVLGGAPETFKPLCEWSQLHPQTTAYHHKPMMWPVVEGRMFMRGYDGVYCFDLRKTN
jgi:outer membrane protein assembly factor BamB